MSMLDTITDAQVKDFYAALKRIAQRGCMFELHGSEGMCPQVHPGNPAQWCPCCIARDALGNPHQPECFTSYGCRGHE